MPETVTIPSRFNGPPDNGNGGYSSGVAASFIEGAAEATLRRPVPVDTPLEVHRADDGEVHLMDGETLVVEARPAPDLDVEVPMPVTIEEARAAKERYRGESDGTFSQCFVCGKGREDAFGVFAGPVEGGELVASPWIPPEWTADAAGYVQPEFVWAVLDCPTYFALYTDGELPMSVLARLTAKIEEPVRTEEEHVVIGWPLEADGRKRHAGAAVLSADGETLAVAHALLIEPRAA
jgi:hypothetical protein